MAILLNNKKKIERQELELHRVTKGVEFIESILDTELMFLNSNLQAIQSLQEDLAYLTKYENQFKADLTVTYYWKYKGVQYQYTLLKAEESQMAYGFQLLVNTQYIALTPRLAKGKRVFDFVYPNQSDKIDKICSEFILQMFKDNHYLTTKAYNEIIAIPRLNKTFNGKPFTNGMQSIKEYCVKEIAQNLSETPELQQNVDSFKPNHTSALKDHVKAQKNYNKALNPNPLGTWIAKLLGDKTALGKLDLINLMRPDRLIASWLLLIVELGILAMTLVLAIVYFGINKFRGQ